MTHLIFLSALLLLISIVLSKTSHKFGTPSLLLFLITGMLAGSEGIGGIEFDDYQFAQFVGNIALIFIIYSGGLETKFSTIRPVLTEGIILSTLGVLLSVFAVGGFVYLVTDFSLLVSLLIGAIVSSTDAAAVFGVFRSRKMGLKHNLRPLLELESGSNDPMAYIMTTTFIYLIQEPNTSFATIGWMLVRSIVLGSIAGWAFGKASLWVINRIKLDTDGLYPVLMMATTLLTFAATDLTGGNGFLAIYISAIILGNSNFVHKRSLMPFSKFSARDKIFISWGGLRGAVPIVFASYALVSGVPQANTIFNIVFFISISSVLIQGTSLPLMARWLRLDLPGSDARQHPLDYETSESFKSELVEVTARPGSFIVDKKVVDLKIPHSVMIILVYRDGKYFAPNGSTVIEQGDILTLMSESQTDVDYVRSLCQKTPSESTTPQ